MKSRTKLKVFAENMSSTYGLAWDVAIGTIGALVASLIYVALFAGGIKMFGIVDNTILIVNQIFKVLCILFGALLSVWRHPVKGWLRGGLTGLLYAVLSFIIFSAITGDWSVSWALLSDVLMGVAVGAIGGILFVNLRLRMGKKK